MLYEHEAAQVRWVTSDPPALMMCYVCACACQVRSMAASTLSAMLEGPAQRGYLAVAEAKTMQQRAPVRYVMRNYKASLQQPVRHTSSLSGTPAA